MKECNEPLQTLTNFSVGTGTSATGTSSQGSVSAGEANGNISQHQARLQAAASAASMYQKSFVYPSPSTLAWYALFYCYQSLHFFQ